MLDLEICKKLKEAGFPQSTEMVYFCSELNLRKQTVCAENWDDLTYCPTFDEIWNWLPSERKHNFEIYQLTMVKLKNLDSTVISYTRQITETATAYLYQAIGKTPSEAAAKMWLLLDESFKQNF